MRKQLSLRLLFVFGMGLSACQRLMERPMACTDSIGCVAIAPGEPIKFGVLQTLSGGSRPAGLEQARTVELAVDERENQLLGHSIQLITEDESCSPEGGANGALRIVADPQVIGIFGTNCSSAAVTAGEIMSKAGLVMISSANTSPELTAVGDLLGTNWVPGYFRTSWNDTEMGRAAATFAAKQLGLTQAAMIHAGDSYTQGLTGAFAKAFKALGGQVVAEIAVDEDDSNLTPTLEAVALSGAELVFFPFSHPQTGIRLVLQAKLVDGLDDITLIGGEAMLSDMFIQEAGPAGVGVYILGPGEPSSAANDQLRQRYEACYGEAPPSFYYSFTYDAVSLLLNAVERIAILEKDGSLSIGRQALRDALYATRNYQGLTGSIQCDQFGDCGVATLDIVRLDATSIGIEQLRLNVVYTYTSNPKR
jgi:branched-chain amino acid transport system substrate-binding protein